LYFVDVFHQLPWRLGRVVGLVVRNVLLELVPRELEVLELGDEVAALLGGTRDVRGDTNLPGLRVVAEAPGDLAQGLLLAALADEVDPDRGASGTVLLLDRDGGPGRLAVGLKCVRWWSSQIEVLRAYLLAGRVGGDGPVGEVVSADSRDPGLALVELDTGLDPAEGRTGREGEGRLAEAEDETGLVVLLRPGHLDSDARRLEGLEGAGVRDLRGLLGGG